MRLATAFVAATVCLKSALAHDAVTDNEGGLASDSLRLVECLTYLSHIVSVDVEHFPSEGTVLGSRIFVSHDAGFCGELDVVCIIEHDEVVESQVSCDAGSSLTYFLLYAAIADIGVDGFLLEGRIACFCVEELGSDGSTYGIGVALSKRTAAVLDASLIADLWVSRRRRAPLTQLL